MPATGDSTGLSVGPAAGLPARPVNVAVAPDGQTVILCDVGAYDTPTDTLYSVGIYRITSPGVLTFTGVITGLSRATQSIAFDPTGHQAYLSGNNSKAGAGLLDSLSVLNITAPGVVALGVDGAATFPLSTTYQLFGVDTIAVVNGKAYLGYPTISDAGYDLRIVDLNTYRVTSLPLSGIPVGVAAIPVRRVYLPLLLKPAP